MEAGTGEDDAVIMEELDKAASVARPLVKVTHLVIVGIFSGLCSTASRIARTCRLRHRPERSRCIHNAQVLLANAALNKDGPSRFERGDIKGHAIQHLDV